MKKMIVLLLSVLLLTLPVAAAEEGVYETAGDLYAAWGGEYPEGVCGVWSVDGSGNHLLFALQDNEAGAAAEAEILALVRNDSTVSFTTFSGQSYSYSALRQIQAEVDLCFDRDVGLIYTGVDERSNCLTVGIDEERQSDPETQAFVSGLLETYGDAITIEYGSLTLTTQDIEIADGVAPPTNMQTVTFDAPEQGTPWGWLALALAVPLLGLGAMFALRKRRAAALVTSNGETHADGPLSTGEVARMVKETEPTPAPSLDARILSAIDTE